MVHIGIERIEEAWPRRLDGAEIGLLVHPASVNRNYEHAIHLLFNSNKCKIKTLFGPQHGIRGETQDNMIEWEGFRDKTTGLQVHSLYGENRKPTREMLKDIDAMVIDLQDIGSRYYTFVWTMALCMEGCSETGKSVVIADRPNPLGGNLTEGPLLQRDYSSFVGLRPLPVRHGMTMGELALWFQNRFYNNLDLHVIHMEGWKRSMWFDETSLPWVLPSPNMPTPDTATVYPGMCLLEATNISEGRGTTRPFEIFGAPFIDPDPLINVLKEHNLPGVVFRPLYFQPTFQKHAGELCGGAQIHITDREKFKPFKTGVAILKSIHDIYTGEFSWNQPPYEYEEEKLPIDILSGSQRLRLDIENGKSIEHMESWWQKECAAFSGDTRKTSLLYGY